MPKPSTTPVPPTDRDPGLRPRACAVRGVRAWARRVVLGVGLAGGCSDDTPVGPGDETTSAGSTTDAASTSDVGSTSDIDATTVADATTGTDVTTIEGSTTGTDSTSTDSTTDTSGATDTGTEATSDSGGEPGCGNGIVEAGEACDEGGPTATCDDDCSPVACGDGLLNAAAGEACDDGGQSVSCDVDCTPAACGDGVVNVLAGEACDDAGRTGACDGDCSLAECGDGITNAIAGEECDDAGESLTCNATCTLAECGDGITNAAAGEACDDAGESLTCNASCTLAQCGDGEVNPTAGELCDEAGASAGCDEDCTAAECGDATLNVQAGESCDAGDLAGQTCEGLGFGPGALGCDGGCAYVTSACAPGMPVLTLSFSPVKMFDFSWVATPGAEHYQLLESRSPGDPFAQLGGDVVGESVSFEMPLHLRWEASYVLRACNAVGCTDSATVDVTGSLAEAVGYVKASNPGANDWFGYSVALSADGSTFAVGVQVEDSSATGIGGNEADNGASDSGAVFVFGRAGAGPWSQQAYIKASNTGADDRFGIDVALSADGSTLAVGAQWEDSSATGIGGNQASNATANSGAVYVFVRNGVGTWSQQAYVKASNTGLNDWFGNSVALSADGNTLAVGAYQEDSSATGIGGNQANEVGINSGAVFVFVRNGAGVWSQQAYVKASNTGALDSFGWNVALSADGNTLAVGAYLEDSSATGIGGNQASDAALESGAVYVFVRDGAGAWSQQAYVKASNTAASDNFGFGVVLSGDGTTLAVSAYQEDSSATGIGGNQADNSASGAGAVYVFVRDGAGAWSQQAYVKASNTAANDFFGYSVALPGDGNTLAVGSLGEDGNATGIGGNPADDTANGAGAVYVFVRDGAGAWSQPAYVKAPNTAANDVFGWSVALTADARTLAVGAYGEDSSATGIGGNQADDGISGAGAVYLY